MASLRSDDATNALPVLTWRRGLFSFLCRFRLRPKSRQKKKRRRRGMRRKEKEERKKGGENAKKTNDTTAHAWHLRFTSRGSGDDSITGRGSMAPE